MFDRTQRPLPEVTPWSEPFWSAAAERRLMIQNCNACSALIMYPKRFCPKCLADDFGWTEASGNGEVYSFTVQQAGAPTGFEDRVPYVIAVIELDEGVQMMSNVVGDDATEVACGDRVVVDFEPVAETGVVLPIFRRRNGG